MRLLGLDPGLNATGWGVVESDGARLAYLACGTVRTRAELALAQRLAELDAALAEAIAAGRPDSAAIEDSFVNRNRTAADVRATFTRHAGSLGETGSVTFLFNRVGVVRYPVETASADEMFEAAVEAGAENVDSDAAGHQVTCEAMTLNDVRDALAARFGEPQGAALEWVPVSTVSVGESQADTLLKLIEALEDNDDVQSVAANFDIADDVLQRLSARP